MKYVVTVETEVEFKFLPHVNKDELLKEFCECIFDTDMEGLERFIAERITLGDYNFIEGVGKICEKFWNDQEVVLHYTCNKHFIETEKL